MSLKLSIDAEVVGLFPAVTVGGFIVAELDPMSVEPLELLGGWATARQLWAQLGVTIEKLADDPRIRGWRDAFSACGVKPSTYKSSVEALVRRALKDGAVSTPLPLVDAYCLASAMHFAPLGAYDIQRLPIHAIELRMARPHADHFQPLGGRATDMPLVPTIPLYASGDTICCWLFNHRDSRETCLEPTTRAAAFVGEAVTERQRIALQTALKDLAMVLTKCGARVGSIGFADGNCHVATLDHQARE